MKRLNLLNQPWHQLKFLSVSPLAQLVAPGEGAELAAILTRVGVFRSWAPGPGNADRLPQARAYLAMPGRGPRSRFCDGTFRVLYAGRALATCVAEMAHHHGQALRDSGEPPGAARIFETLGITVSGAFVDVRAGHPALHRPGDFGPAQAFGAECRMAGEDGLAYRSVRQPGGECLAVLAGTSLRAVRLKGILALRWDGERLLP